MKVLLVNPPRKTFRGSETVQVGLPLGLLYLAAVLEQAGYKVEILDTLLDCKHPRHVEDYLVYGMPWHEIESKIKESKPDLVGITNPFSTEIDNALELARIVKKIDSCLPTIIGGPHASAQYLPLLEEASYLDVAVIGEGELTVVDLVRAYEQGGNLSQVKGIAYQKDGKIMVNPPREYIVNLDELPLPAYHLLDMSRYLNPHLRYRTNTKFRREIQLITSRGCPFNCVFCSIHTHMGRRWRAHSVDYVLSHIDHVVHRYGVQHIHFEDDNLTLDTERFGRILDGLRERGLRISWTTSNGIRADNLTLPLIQKMKESGCTDLFIGIESGDQEILDNIIGKRLRLENVVKTAAMCQQVDIKVFGFYIIGFPGEKKENMQKTVDFALWLKRKYDVGMNLFIAEPLYGSRLHKICEDKGYLTSKLMPRSLSEARNTWGKGLIKTEDFDPEDVKRIALQAVSSYDRLNLRNHLKHPVATLHKSMFYRRAAVRYLKSLIKLQG